MPASSSHSPAPALVADGTGRVLSADAAADRAAGRPLAGTHLRDLLADPGDWTTFQHHARLRLVGGDDAPLRVPILSADRRGVEVEVHVHAVAMRGGAAIAARAIQLI